MNPAEGVSLAWTVTGPLTAPAVILVHSLGTDGSMWEEQVEALRGRYRVIRVDLRGHGRSPAPAGPYALAALARDVLKVADTTGVDRFHYVGISLGGLIGLWLGVHLPGRLKGLVAANTAARIGTEALWRERIDAVQRHGMSQLCDSALQRWFAPDFSAANPERVARVAQVLAATDPAGYAGCCAALAEADLRHEVGAIQVPVLILGGTLDAATPVADARWLHETIRGSHLQVIEGAAHLSNLDQHEAFNGALCAFLDRQGAP